MDISKMLVSKLLHSAHASSLKNTQTVGQKVNLCCFYLHFIYICVVCASLQLQVYPSKLSHKWWDIRIVHKCFFLWFCYFLVCGLFIDSFVLFHNFTEIHATVCVWFNFQSFMLYSGKECQIPWYSSILKYAHQAVQLQGKLALKKKRAIYIHLKYFLLIHSSNQFKCYLIYDFACSSYKGNKLILKTLMSVHSFLSDNLVIAYFLKFVTYILLLSGLQGEIRLFSDILSMFTVTIDFSFVIACQS